MKWLKKHYWIVYAIGFIVISYIVFQEFLWNGKGFVWQEDGQKQHIVALAYYGDWLRQVGKGILYEHRFVLPMWDLSIGQGSDILTTLNYYVLGDPLNLLSVFVKKEKVEALYSGLVLLRMFLAGVSFSLYCFYHKHGKKEVLMGSYMYCFSCFVLFNGIRHPYFTNPLIYLPVMLLGIDKIFKKEKPYVFVVSTSIAAASNFYFFYMLVVICVVYVLILYKKQVGRWQWKELWGWFFKFVCFGLLALMLAAVVFLPSAMAVLSTGRMGVKNYIPLLFNADYYVKLPVALMAQTNVQYANRPGVAVPAMLAILTLFVKKKNRELKIAFVGMMLVFCIPYAGSVMNGFSYISYRCSFVSAFLLAYIFVKIFPQMLRLSEHEKYKLLCLAVVYLGVILCVERIRSEQVFVMGVLLLWCLCGVLLCEEKKQSLLGVELLFGVVTVVSIGFAAYYMYSTQQGDYVSEFIDKNAAVERVSNLYNSNEEKEYQNPSDILRDIRDKNELGRMEMYGCSDASQNAAMLQKFYGVSYYFSVSNPYISQFHEEMALLMKTEFNYRQLDCRSYLDAVNNVKYYVTKPDESRNYKSALFREEALTEKNGYQLYVTENNLGFAYAYDSCFSREDYEQMIPVQRQEMLLQGAMLEEEDMPSEMKRTQYEFHNMQRDYTIESDKNIVVENGKIRVLKDGASLTLYFEGKENCETYVLIKGLGFDAGKEWKRRLEEKKKEASFYERYKLGISSLYYNEPDETDITITANTGKGGGSLNFKGEKNSFYRGEADYMWNLGYSPEAICSATITFDEKGEYAIESLSVYCQPVDNEEEAIAAMKVEGGDCFVAGVNSFSGKVTLDEKKLLCFSVPYSKGWKVYVDGEEQKVLQTNTMFMSVLLDAGVHHIEMKYQTPYIREGMIIELLGVIVLLVMVVRDLRKL